MEQTAGPAKETGGLDLSALLGSLGGNAGGGESGPDLSALLGLLGSGGGGEAKAGEGSGSSGGGVDFASLLGMLGGLPRGGEEPPPPPRQESPPGGGLPFDPALISTLTRAMAALREPDRNIQLLEALRPFLEEERRKKVDEAVKILHLMRLAPLLQESGVLGKLMGE